MPPRSLRDHTKRRARPTALPGYRTTGLPGYRATGLPGYRATGLPGYRTTDTDQFDNFIHNVDYIRPMPAVLGDFEQLVLLALVRLGPDAYGATIRREIEARTERELSISAVYTTLQRLEQKGLVRSRVGDPFPERGGRRRKYLRALAARRQGAESGLRGLCRHDGRRRAPSEGLVTGRKRLLCRP